MNPRPHHDTPTPAAFKLLAASLFLLLVIVAACPRQVAAADAIANCAPAIASNLLET